MSGEFRIAVAEFASQGSDLDSETGRYIAEGIYNRLNAYFSDGNPGRNNDILVELWGPEQVEQATRAFGLESSTPDSLAASLIEADVLVYGEVSRAGSHIQVTPKFFVTARSFYEMEELTGQHNLGATIPISSSPASTEFRIETANKTTKRANALAHMILGLGYYSIREYDEAIKVLQQADSGDFWDSEEGKEVLYLFIGNAAIRKEDATNANLDVAEEFFTRSLAVSPDYARAMLGLANVYYRKALLPIGVSNDPKDLNLDLIHKALNLLSQARSSPNQPPLSDITVKYHFELGQSYLALGYAGQPEYYELAINEFKAVIAAYGDGANPRIQERAAESYARLGLISQLTGDSQKSRDLYRTACQMSTNPGRKELYREQLVELGSHEDECD